MRRLLVAGGEWENHLRRTQSRHACRRLRQALRHPPFNTYRKHVHDVAGDVYGFPYDDVGVQSGDLGALSATGLTVAYCPGAP